MDEARKHNAEQIIYTNFVEQLFKGRRQLLLGVCMQVACILCVIVETGHAWFFVFGIAAALVGLWRVCQIDQYHASKAHVSGGYGEPDSRWYKRWETRSTLSAMSAAAVIGGFGGAAFYWGGTNFALVVSVMIVFATFPSVIVRLYGSMRVVVTSVTMLFAPLILAVIAQWSSMSALLVLLSAPFAFSAVSLARSVRSTFVFSVLGNLEKRELGQRLQDAVGSMSHGMMMIDAERQIIVINEQCRKMFEIPEGFDLHGKGLAVAVRCFRRFGPYSEASVHRLHAALEKLIDGDAQKVKCPMQNGRVFELSASSRRMGGYVILIEDISEQEATRKSIELMRSTDNVTGLPNRETFQTLVSKALDNADVGTRSALIVFDIDDFKAINDNAGHMQGDRMLKAVGMTAKRHLGRCAVVTRQGADEFVAFVQGRELDELDVATGLVKALSRQFTIGVEQFAITVSAGVAVLEPTDHDAAEAVIKAGVALVEAKSKGIGSTCLYTAAMDAKQLRRQFLKNALANAITDGDINPLYQPVVDIKTGKLVGCEALSRWESEVFGVVSAEEFIPLAEEMGYISTLTKHILEQAIKDCSTWERALSVSVNLSPRDFLDGKLVDWLIDHIGSVKFDPARLEVEITESSFIQNPAFVARKLNALRQCGVRVALDDFGTGYSSFNYLHQLPLDRVKIDRSFLADSANGEAPVALLEGIISICSQLGLKTTVEGVETEDQVALLQSIGGVQRMQGFFFGSALPGSAIQAFAEAQAVNPIRNKPAA
ncbi:MAG: EAL domain-containing protein [Pseudomonadota bacterium]